MKILIDINMTPRWVTFFMSVEIDAMYWSTLGRRNAPDSEIIKFAQDNDYVVLTNDMGFGTNLAATRQCKPSVVQLRAEDVNPEAIDAKVLSAISQMVAELESGAILTVHANRTRMSLLPLLMDKPQGP